MAKETYRQTEVKLSSLSPVEIWERLGLAQPRDEKEPEEIFSENFLDEESRRAFETFRQDCPLEKEPVTMEFISSKKGGIFLISLLKECARRSPSEKKKSSVNYIFKDDVEKRMAKEGRKSHISFDNEEFDKIAKFLKEKHLVALSRDGIRITRTFSALFHQSYGARLVF